MNTFQLRSNSDNDSTSLVFDATEEYDEDFECTNVYIGDPKTFVKACVFITVDKSSTAVLQNAAYKPSCTKDGSLKQGTGTAIMLKIALMYIFDKFKHVQNISINDKSMIPNGQIHITAKRLLQGRNGWYQDILGAIPDPNHKQTIYLIKELQTEKAKQAILAEKNVTSKRGWGTQKDIETMSVKIVPKYAKYIIGTMWVVTRESASKYDISTTISGGGEKTKHIWHRRKLSVNRTITKYNSQLFESYKNILKLT